jgi:hypothetical protein
MRTAEAEIMQATDEELTALIAGNSAIRVLRDGPEREAALMERDRRRLEAAQQARIQEDVDRLRTQRQEAKKPKPTASPGDRHLRIHGVLLNGPEVERLKDLIWTVAIDAIDAVFRQVRISSVETVIVRGDEEEEEEEGA